MHVCALGMGATQRRHSAARPATALISLLGRLATGIAVAAGVGHHAGTWCTHRGAGGQEAAVGTGWQLRLNTGRGASLPHPGRPPHASNVQASGGGKRRPLPQMEHAHPKPNTRNPVQQSAVALTPCSTPPCAPNPPALETYRAPWRCHRPSCQPPPGRHCRGQTSPAVGRSTS